MLGYNVSLVRKDATMSKKMVVFQVVPYRHRPSSAVRVMFSTFGAQLLVLCYTVIIFLLVIYYKRYRVYCFLTPSFLPSTPAKYVIYLHSGPNSPMAV